MSEIVKEAQCPDCGEWFDFGAAAIEPCEGCHVVRLEVAIKAVLASVPGLPPVARDLLNAALPEPREAG